MQEERERGRILGLRKRRLETAAWAATFIPLFAEARLELPEYAGRGEPSQQAYANWLNHPSRSIPSRNKGQWSSETVRRLFDSHIGLIDEAEREFDISMAIIRFKWKHGDTEARKALTDEEARVHEDRAKDINDAYRLSAHLRGRTYTDQDIPARLPIVSSVRKKRSPPKDVSVEPDEPVEVQLSFF